MKRIFLSALLIGAALIPWKSAYTVESTQYWMKVKATNKFERSVVADTGVSIELNRDDYVIAIGNVNEKNRLEKMGLLEASYALTENFDFPVQDKDYHNYAELKDALVKINQEYPDITRLSSIGKSVEQREIYVIRVSKDPDNASGKPAVLFMGGHHAREHLSVEMPLRFLQNLLTEYKNGNQRIVQLIETRDIHVIPAVNPDGLEFDIASGRYQYWRKNRVHNANGSYGVDLNRNYGYQWGTGGSSSDPYSDVYKGPTPFSEPETRAIRDYVDAHTNISILLSFHTFSQLILYPWGHKYDPIEDNRDVRVHEIMAQTMAKWNGYTPEQSSDLYIASGDTTDWSYGAHKIISFTFELDPASSFSPGGFYPGPGVIPDVVRKNTEPCLYLLDLADNPYRVLSPDPLTPSYPN